MYTHIEMHTCNCAHVCVCMYISTFEYIHLFIFGALGVEGLWFRMLKGLEISRVVLSHHPEPCHSVAAYKGKSRVNICPSCLISGRACRSPDARKGSWRVLRGLGFGALRFGTSGFGFRGSVRHVLPGFKTG